MKNYEGFFLEEDIDKFSELLLAIEELCFGYYEVWYGTGKPMSEAELVDLVNNYYLQLQEAFPFGIPKISNNKQRYEDLISRSFRFLMVTIGLEILIANSRLFKLFKKFRRNVGLCILNKKLCLVSNIFGFWSDC